ncbi:replication enhancer protein [Sunn hemp leaf distortion virus [India:Barrackpore2:2008]]|uniref:Transcriptional activator protein n=1 Tax=Sunn hemp leaf distortion virus TaxID=579113 RepID=B9V4F3_9GEMI|nr:replication enhancer protein [Sunn hemp leaf distortion virus]ACM62304.1 replication enhancer protein [Sunn hemp leaf distortion virus]ACS92545.1 replication enhancer protein [Sunn hemp leaf distortion virus [India:Barrackpore2:2008]]ACS92551.1 replication enhancer protein [Sunn hemp leaf distortion virus [India:Barrackpore3:2008]]
MGFTECDLRHPRRPTLLRYQSKCSTGYPRRGPDVDVFDSLVDIHISYHSPVHDHGFTHRGTHHCSSSRDWRVYLGDSKSPLFQDTRAPEPSISHQPRYKNRPNTVQSQPKESTGDSQLFPILPNLDVFTASDWSFLLGLKD